MPRKARNFIKTSFIHIMVQGINREYIFNKDEYIKKYLEFIKKAKKRIDVDVIAYCIMTNHAHFLIKYNDIRKVTEFMHDVNTSYAKYYNYVQERVGYVFRDRYKIQEIIDQKHLYGCIEYIHNNPVKAKMCDTQDEYEYSSFNQIYHGDKEKLYEEIARHKQIVHRLDETLKRFGIGIDEENQGHKKFKENEHEMIFMDDNQNKEDICEKIINEYFSSKGITKSDIINNKEKLIELVVNLKVLYNVSYRIMEKKLGLSRETIRKMVINNKS